MRHLWSLFAGLVVAPLTWVLLALAQDGSTRTIGGWEERAAFDTTQLLAPAGYLAAAGVLVGLIATLRISPLGPLVAGLLLTTGYGLMFINPFRVHDTLPENWSILGDRIPLQPPLDNGTVGLVGVLLLMAVFSAQRWRRWPAVAGPVSTAPEDPAAGSLTGGPDGSTETLPEPVLLAQTYVPAERSAAPLTVSSLPAGPTAGSFATTEDSGTDLPLPTGPVAGTGDAPVAASTPASGPADGQLLMTSGEDDLPAQRRPKPRSRRPVPDKSAAPTEGPWAAPPRPSGKDD